MIPYFDGYTKVCDGCGKEFVCMNRAGYKYVITNKGKKYYYCCYSCWMKAKKQMNIKPRRRMK